MVRYALVAALLVSGGIGAAIGRWAWGRREIPGTALFSLTLFALSGWAVSGAAELLTDGLRLTVLVMTIRWTIVATVAPLWLFFSLQYTHRPEADSTLLKLVAVAPSFAYVIAWWTNGIHHGVWGEYVLHSAGLPVLVFDPAWPFWAFVFYSYAATLTGVFVLFAALLKSRSLFRGQTLALIFGPLIVMAPNLVYLSGVAPEPRIDISGLGLIGFGITMTWALYRYELFGFAPVTRDAIMETIDEAVFAFDHGDRLVDINPGGRRLLERDRLEQYDVLLSREADEIMPSDLREFIDKGESGTVSLVQDGETRHFSVQTSTVSLYPEVTGRVLVVNDVTTQVEREEKLRMKNRQLDRFVGTVSHDLRNPLQTARGYAELARQIGDAEHFDELEASLERMERIIEDSLELAKSAEELESTMWVSLEAVARDAWSQVDTADATLSLEAGREALADRSRLQRVFENLFRNAVEHAGRDATVRVTETEDGFRVADDGPGIDADDPATVFDHGFTTDADGTGYGLSIVETIARTHGWEVEAGTSWEDGAAFTVSNVPARTPSSERRHADESCPERSATR